MNLRCPCHIQREMLSLHPVCCWRPELELAHRVRKSRSHTPPPNSAQWHHIDSLKSAMVGGIFTPQRLANAVQSRALLSHSLPPQPTIKYWPARGFVWKIVSLDVEWEACSGQIQDWPSFRGQKEGKGELSFCLSMWIYPTQTASRSRHWGSLPKSRDPRGSLSTQALN